MTEEGATPPRGFHLVFQDDVAILTMNMGENRINDKFIDEMNLNLDIIERNKDCHAYILTGGESSKFFCNGRDLAYSKTLDVDGERKLKQKRVALLYRLLTFPLVTIAAINGHAFAAGAFLAMCHDYQVMGSGKGWWCLNEVHIGIRMTPFNMAVVKAKLPTPTYHHAVVLGRRYTGDEAMEAGVITRVVPGPVLPQALMFARQMLPKGGYNRTTLQNFKEDTYHHVGLLCSDDQLISQESKL